MSGLRDLDVKPYKGIEQIKGKYIATGIPRIDYALNDLAPGRITLLLGRMNSGKTTLVRQIIANAINADNKIFIINGEEQPELFINALYKCVIGRNKNNYDTIMINKRYHKEPKQETIKALKNWHKGKLIIFSKADSKLRTIDELFEMVSKQIKDNKPDLIIIDNLMSLLSCSSNEKNEKQSDFIQRCHDMAILHNIHILIVLHPNKTYSKGADLEVEHASGTSDMANKADNVIGIVREEDSEKIANGVNGYVYVLKNRYYSELIKVEVLFDVETGLLLQSTDGKVIGYSFNLDQHYECIENIQMPFDL